MLAGLLIFIFCLIITYLLIGRLKKAYPFIDESTLIWLFFYHYVLWVAYYTYAIFNPSDSQRYYNDVTIYVRNNWLDYFGTSTTFIDFLAYPFAHYLNLNYESMMVLFAFIGYLGFLYFYIFFKEHVKFKHNIYGTSLLNLILFLPNNHFWSVSLGKGSVIFFGLGLFFYALGSLSTRYLAAILGGLLIYFVRPHIMFVLLIGMAVGLLSTTKNINVFLKFVFIAGVFTLLVVLYDDILKFTGLNQDFFEESTTLAHRASELSKATSGVNVQSYSVPFQLFTFWFRPLFIDAPGMLGLIVSVENLIYLIIVLYFVRWDFFTFLWKGDYLVKTAFITFIIASYPLAQLSGNLGIAIRQKAMLMILLFFLIMYYQDHKKRKNYKSYIAYLKQKENIMDSEAETESSVVQNKNKNS